MKCLGDKARVTAQQVSPQGAETCSTLSVYFMKLCSDGRQFASDLYVQQKELLTVKIIITSSPGFRENCC